MASQATRQRKGGTSAPKSGELALQPLANMGSAIAHATLSQQAKQPPTNSLKPNRTLRPAIIKEAKVKRNKFGTGPFDENWLNLDCCGLFCAFFTYMLHAYGVYAVCLILIPPWMSTVNENGTRSMSLMGHFHRACFTLVAALAVYSHFKAMTTNPGAVPPDAMPLEDRDLPAMNNSNSENGDSFLLVEGKPRKGRRLCRRCNAFKPKRAHHCSVCKRCVVKMDHHCPWVNNCVGIGNHKYFLLFIFYTCISCVYSLSLLCVRFFDCLGQHGHVRTHHLTCLDRPTQLLSILGLFIEAILFGLFTSCMMFDQWGVVVSNVTNIDRLKGGDSSSTSLPGVVEVFGLNPKKGLDLSGTFRPDWLSPFHPIYFPSTLRDEIMGYCTPAPRTNKKNINGSVEETELAPMLRNVVANIV